MSVTTGTVGAEEDRRFLEEPLAAVLTTYRRDGTAAPSPVWYRAHGDRLEVVIEDGGTRLRHLRRKPLCSLVVLEAGRPFRGLRVEGEALVESRGAAEAALAIARRYLGEEEGARFVAGYEPGLVVSLPLAGARRWEVNGDSGDD